MFRPKTTDELFQCMKYGTTVEIKKVCGFISQIQKEDGSGRRWNVTIDNAVVGENVKLTPASTIVFFEEK